MTLAARVGSPSQGRRCQAAVGIAAGVPKQARAPDARTRATRSQGGCDGANCGQVVDARSSSGCNSEVAGARDGGPGWQQCGKPGVGAEVWCFPLLRGGVADAGDGSGCKDAGRSLEQGTESPVGSSVESQESGRRCGASLFFGVVSPTRVMALSAKMRATRSRRADGTPGHAATQGWAPAAT